MADQKPRPDRLPVAVLRILIERAEPLTGLQLSALLRDSGRAVALSAVYRAIRELVDRGAARKIWLLRAYVSPCGGQAIECCCRRCGAHVRAEGAATHAALGRIAAERGFRVSGTIVEVPGLCAECSSERRRSGSGGGRP